MIKICHGAFVPFFPYYILQYFYILIFLWAFTFEYLLFIPILCFQFRLAMGKNYQQISYITICIYIYIGSHTHGLVGQTVLMKIKAGTGLLIDSDSRKGHLTKSCMKKYTWQKGSRKGTLDKVLQWRWQLHDNSKTHTIWNKMYRWIHFVDPISEVMILQIFGCLQYASKSTAKKQGFFHRNLPKIYRVVLWCDDLNCVCLFVWLCVLFSKPKPSTIPKLSQYKCYVLILFYHSILKCVSILLGCDEMGGILLPLEDWLF